MITQWANAGNKYFLQEVTNYTSAIAPGVYKLESTPTGQLFLSYSIKEFEFPYKIYGKDRSFIERVKRSYNHTAGNVGILLNGVKGTGKTVTAKQICNELNLPVIVVSDAFGGFVDFLNEIQQDVVIFIDEFEKVYNEKDHALLSVMDGALTNGYRRAFILTTNATYINDNLKQRPSRIRYIKQYDNLSVDVINEVVDDLLIHKELRDSLVDYIAQLELITIDIVKAVIQEANIHNEGPDEFKDVFNVKTLEARYNVYEIVPGSVEPVKLYSNVKIWPTPITKESSVGKILSSGYEEVGRILEVIDPNTITVDIADIGDDNHEVKLKEGETSIKRLYIESAKQYHYGYAF